MKYEKYCGPFEPISPQVPLEVVNEHTETVFKLFWLENSHNSSNSCSENENLHEVQILVIGEYILQKHPGNLQLQYGLKLDANVLLRCLTKLETTEKSLFENKNKNKIAIGIELVLPYKNSIKLLNGSSSEAESLQNLIKVLKSKNIRQLDFSDKFQPHRIIGKGSSAVVFLAEELESKKMYAIKAFCKGNFVEARKGEENYKIELKILNQLKHKNLVSLVETFESEKSIYFVMELLSFNLFQFLGKFGFPTEEATKFIIINLLHGLKHMHDLKIMHRDIKLENIMFRQEKKDMFIPVIIDFGLGGFVDELCSKPKRCGTPGFTAPEILSISEDSKIGYNEACDIFSLGVVCHILLFKKPVFEGESHKEVLIRNTECNINYQSEIYKGNSDLGLDFAKKMLEKDPKLRMTITEALSHPFLESSLNKELEKEEKVCPWFPKINKILC